MELEYTEHPILKPPSDEDQLALLESDPEAYLQSIQLHNDRIEASIIDPVYNSFVLPQQQMVKDILSKPEIDECWTLGGNRCFSLSTTYVFDPVANEHKKASEIDGDFHVYAWDNESQKVVIAMAEKPFIKGYEEMYRVTLDDGSWMDVTENHRFMLPDGNFEHLKNLGIGSLLAGLSPQMDVSRPDTQSSCARTDFHISEDYQCDCQSSRHSCGESPLQLGETDLETLRQLGDAPLRNHDHMIAGDLDETLPCSFHPSSIPYCPSSRFCWTSRISDSLMSKLRGASQYLLGLTHSLLGLESLQCDSGQSVDTSDSETSQPSVSFARCFSSEHPNGVRVLLKSQKEQAPHGEVSLFSLFSDPCLETRRIVGIVSSGKGLVGDFSVPYYENYYAQGFFNHNSGKSRSAAWLVMQALIENPNTEIICWSQNEDASVERQQPYLWEMMPQEYKKKQKDEVAKINYSKATGFTGNKFILPNGSVCYFKFYTQFQNDDSVIEGAKLGAPRKECKFINIGTWCDEYLGDETLLKRLRSRCGDFDAKILVTFTPLRGYTPCVGSMLDGAKTIESLPASLLDGELMPYVQEPAGRDNMAIVYYHSERNPFSNWKRLARNHANASVEEIKKVLYGYPTKSMTAMFGTFDQVAHIYDPQEEKIDFSDGSWTNYQVIDPAGAKSWACAWYGVNAKGDVRQWAEWPDRATYGEWAVEGKSQVRSDDAVTWKRGPAAEDCGGLSIRSLQMEWTKIEGNIPIFERIIDIRFAHSPKQTADDGERTLQDELYDIGIETVPSFGAHEDVGLAKIQEWLAFDNKQPFDKFTNSPSFRMSTDCGNSIFSFMNYCQNGKKDEPLKDFIDLPRYAATHCNGSGIEFYAKDAFISTSTIGGY